MVVSADCSQYGHTLEETFAGAEESVLATDCSTQHSTEMHYLFRWQLSAATKNRTIGNASSFIGRRTQQTNRAFIINFARCSSNHI